MHAAHPVSSSTIVIADSVLLEKSKFLGVDSKGKGFLLFSGDPQICETSVYKHSISIVG